MNIIKKLLSKNGLPFTFIVFYSVGLALFFIPLTRPLFIQIAPYTLLLVAVAVFVHHTNWNARTISVLVSIFFISIVVEIAGVASGKLFGIYSYGQGLGIKIAEVPIIIGLNWVILIYGSNALLSKVTTNSLARILGASALMVVYDLILEKAAPLLDMWSFENSSPPVRNYVMWFILAFVFQLAVVVFNLNTNNKPARALFITQLVFFLIIVNFS